MRPAPLHFFSRRDQWLPWLFFVSLAVVGIVASAVTLAPLALNALLPNFWLLVMFVWVLWRPELTSSSLFFLLGLVQDLTLALPLGLHAGLSVLFWYGLARLRPFIFARPFFWHLLAFAVFQALYYLLLAILAWPFGLPGFDLVLLPRWILGMGLFILFYRPLFLGLRLIVNFADAR